MSDVLYGKVINVVDGDTFDLLVTNVAITSLNRYNQTERIRFAGTNAPEMNTPLGVVTKLELSSKILFKNVRCEVKARDIFHRVVCDVYIN